MTEFVKVIYTGKEKETGRVFETNDEKTAKELGIYDPKRKYEPSLMILGEGMLIKGFEEALKEMKEGEEKTVEIPPEKAYGERNPELVKLVPLSAFKKSGITPEPGMILTFDGVPARIQSVSSGRVRVDFNHQLAGKTLIFNIKLVKKLKKPEEIAEALVKETLPNSKVELKEKQAVIKVSKQDALLRDIQIRKTATTNNLKKYLKLEKVSFEEEY